MILNSNWVGGLEAKNIDNIKDSYGAVLGPEINYRPIDNLELTVGAYLFGGKSGTLLGSKKDQDQIYFEAKFSF